MKFYPCMSRGSNPQTIILTGNEPLPDGFESITDYACASEKDAKELISLEISRRQRHAAYHA